MFPGRFWAAIGSGEAANERVTGDVWPRKDVRDARLVECVDVIRRLLSGEEVNHDGLVTVTGVGCGPSQMPCRPRRPRRHRRDRRPARRMGRRAHHRQPAARRPPAGARRLPRRRGTGRGCGSRSTSAGRPPTTRRRRSPTTSGGATSTVRRWHGTPRRSRPSTPWPRRSRPTRSPRWSTSRRPRPARGVDPGLRRPGLGGGLPPLRRQGAEPFVDAFGEHVLPQLDPRATGAGHDRPTGRRARGGHPMKLSQTGDVWWKTAVLYCADVRDVLRQRRRRHR